MIIEFKVSVSTCYVGSKVSDVLTIEVDDDATQEEIELLKEEVAKEWLWSNIDFYWD